MFQVLRMSFYSVACEPSRPKFDDGGQQTMWSEELLDLLIMGSGCEANTN